MDLLDSLPAIVFSVHLSADERVVFDYCNHRVTHFLDVSVEDIQKNSGLFFSRFHAEKIEYVKSLMSHSIKSQQPMAFECEILTSSKTPLWMLVQITPRGETSFGKTASGVMSDISESYVAKTSAIQTANHFMYLQDQLPDRFYYKDQNSIFRGGNKAWYTHHGYSCLADIIGKSDADSKVLSDTAKAEILAKEKEMMRTGIPTQNREHYKNLQGEDVYSDAKKAPLYNSANQPIGLVGITRDVTAQVKAEMALEKAKEEAEQSAKAKSSFLAVMSHEIRTPMNGVIGCASLLSSSALNAEQEQLVNTIQTCGESLLVLINDILDYSKIEAGKNYLECSPFQLRLLIEDCIELFTKQVYEKQLELNYYIEADVPLTLNGDATRIRQIINNLVGNAIKFTAQGEVFIDVSLTTLDEQHKKCGLLISVRDTGIGISEENQENLFSAFTQADSSITRKFGGTGLGLVICKKIIEQMDGDIWFKSTSGAGTTFYATMMLNFEIQDSDNGLASAITNLKGTRVLIVDDNATNRKVLASTIMQWGMIPVAFDSPKNAMENLHFGHEYDLVLLDFCMPKTNGCDLARDIKKLPKMFDKPIIILSSAATQKNEMHSVDACLLKPVRNSMLQKTIEQVLGEVSVREAVKRKPVEKYPIKATRILVVEDNTVNQLVLSMMLKKLGYTHFSCVSDGEEAVAQSKAIDFDIIFMDIQMLRMDGYTASKLIRQEKQNSAFPWIIALTAGAQKEDSDRAFGAGMNAFTTKPIHFEGLKAVLAHAENSISIQNV